MKQFARATAFDISIHAPRVGSDFLFAAETVTQSISIHAPRVGSDTRQSRASRKRKGFQSTLPVWGATF